MRPMGATFIPVLPHLALKVSVLCVPNRAFACRSSMWYRVPNQTARFESHPVHQEPLLKVNYEALTEQPSPFKPVTRLEKRRLSAVLRATEHLFLENMALKLLLTHYDAPKWQPLVKKLLADKEIVAGVRLKLRDIYSVLDGLADPSTALDTLLAELPGRTTIH
jgi:hypothetical protein